MRVYRDGLTYKRSPLSKEGLLRTSDSVRDDRLRMRASTAVGISHVLVVIDHSAERYRFICFV